MRREMPCDVALGITFVYAQRNAVRCGITCNVRLCAEKCRAMWHYV